MRLNLSAPINFLSYGMVSTNLLLNLVKSGIEVALWPIGQVQALPEYHDLIRNCVNNTALYSKDSPSLRIFHEHSLAEHVGKGQHIGFPIFEVNKFDQVRKTHLSNQDHLIVASKWAKQVIKDNGIEVPTTVVPLGFDPDIFYAKADKKKFNGEPTKFIHIGKREYRKSQAEMLECFEQAFGLSDDVELTVVWGSELLKNINKIEYDSWTNLFNRSKLASKIKLVEWIPSQMDVANLLRESDCGLFLSKAEGFNLGLLESMAVGNNNIVFLNSGMTEFADDSCMLVQPTEEEKIFDGVWFSGNDNGTWPSFGKSQKDQTIEFMKEAHRLKQGGYNLFNGLAVDRASNFTWENSAKKLINVLGGSAGC